MALRRNRRQGNVFDLSVSFVGITRYNIGSRRHEDDMKETKNSKDDAGESADRSSSWKQLASALESRKGEKHAIVLQEFPDPDAIACGFAHQIISRAFDIETTILYCGRISHQQNIALVKLIGVDLVKYEASMDLAAYAGAVFVDNQGTTAGPILDALEEKGVPMLGMFAPRLDR